ncbi:hypothetical protein DESUT3_06390 [Desulfuromonas versatilis]|uniref:Hydrogen-dependent growth transcriptional repressor n=1 Tax=Desulfuromonas versatilis TaxID=2802975 RepID=A0ABM8HSZ0_9BACT|nr:ribbon-helix-helix protein, CopG family [Desulfuromonas versatilis]BCR03570.1 hypothetical protein DESUT3_06390 [Desulfuromonas versatilis]
MGKTVENPKKFIISCRIDDQEMQLLQELAKEANTSISNLLRQSLTMLDSGTVSSQAVNA